MKGDNFDPADIFKITKKIVNTTTKWFKCNPSSIIGNQ